MLLRTRNPPFAQEASEAHPEWIGADSKKDTLVSLQLLLNSELSVSHQEPGTRDQTGQVSCNRQKSSV